MFDFLHSFLLCFVPLLVAVDAIGVLPVFISLTADVPSGRLRRLVTQSVITAALVALAFITVGQAILHLLGITVNDFMIAGGVLLFVISMNDLLSLEARRRQVDQDSLGVVPIGVPLITGPAVLTTSLLLLNTHGTWPTALAIVVNVALAGVVFAASRTLFRLLGKSGAKAASKVASLLLAAIAVMMVRKGIMNLIAIALSGVNPN